MGYNLIFLFTSYLYADTHTSRERSTEVNEPTVSECTFAESIQTKVIYLFHLGVLLRHAAVTKGKQNNWRRTSPSHLPSIPKLLFGFLVRVRATCIGELCSFSLVAKNFPFRVPLPVTYFLPRALTPAMFCLRQLATQHKRRGGSTWPAICPPPIWLLLLCDPLLLFFPLPIIDVECGAPLINGLVPLVKLRVTPDVLSRSSFSTKGINNPFPKNFLCVECSLTGLNYNLKRGCLHTRV